MRRPKTKTKRCAECGRRRVRLHIEWHPGCEQWQCSDDVERCRELYFAAWPKGVKQA